MKRVHFVGIAGVGLSAMARVMLERGASVSGSDLRADALTDALAKQGARISLGHHAENVHGADLVVVSSAVPADNPEITEAKRLGIPVLKRAEFLEELIAGQKAICIAGTHGKTTTTAMIALLLYQAGLDPSFIVGGVVPELATNARAGQGMYFVIEADEYDGMFFGLRPWIAVITNVELDHVDNYPSLEDVRRAFVRFASRTVPSGVVLACADNAAALSAAQEAVRQQQGSPLPTLVTYGLRSRADWEAVQVRPNELGGTTFTVLHAGRPFGQFELAIPGLHNVSNALAALAVGAMLGLDSARMAQILRDFHGVERRFEIRGEAGGVIVVDDYAHHPTEITATLRAARERFPGQRVWAVFQPHTYSRTRAFFEAFAQSFGDADHVIVTDIYAAREKDNGTVSSSELAQRMLTPSARYIGSLDEAASYLLDQIKPGDVVMTLGAGDVRLVGDKVLAGLRKQHVFGIHEASKFWALAHLEKALRREGLHVVRDEPLARHTSFQIGGPADLFVSVKSIEALIHAVHCAVEYGVPYFILGGGTNVLVGDRGYRGLVIRNNCAHMEITEAPSGWIVHTDAGVSLPMLTRQMIAHSLGGLTWAEGIPGTVGGAIVHNAGAFGSSMADVVLEVDWLDGQGQRGTWNAEALGFGYRTSRLKSQKGLVVLGARLKLDKQDAEELRSLKLEYAKYRRKTQPRGASAGCVFKNPPNVPAGRLIEEAGLKGRRIGGAHISSQHANFIINDQWATARDVRALIDVIRAEVSRRFGIELELEIEIVGEF